MTKKRSTSGRRSRHFVVGLAVFSIWLATNFHTSSSQLAYQHDNLVRGLPLNSPPIQRSDLKNKIVTNPVDLGQTGTRQLDQGEHQPQSEEEPQAVHVDRDLTDDVFLSEPQEVRNAAPTKRQLQEPLLKTDSDAYFIKRGKNFHVTSRGALDLHDRLPAGTYSIGIAEAGEYFLQTIDSFEIHGKIYGDTKKQSERILKTFLDRRGSTGVLLSGEKGSGKTFLAKYIAMEAAREYQIPTVVVNQPLFGERFNAFIQSIQQPTIFLFDEFEKIYAEKDPRARAMEEEMVMEHSGHGSGGGSYNQDSMLTLLDGTYTTKMLFILTTNNKYRVSTHMRNRPGRIYYVIDFTGLPLDFIQEYCQDKLKDKTKIPQVVAVSNLFEAFSFDMLQAMVEEMNRYNETPEQVLDYLNVRPEFAIGSQYMMKLLVNGVEIPDHDMHSGRRWFGNPLVGVVIVHYQKPRKRDTQPPMIDGEKTKLSMEEMMMIEEEYNGRSEEVQFTAKDIDGMDSTTGTFSYWNGKKRARLILTKDTTRTGGPSSTNGALLQMVSQLGSVGSRPQQD